MDTLIEKYLQEYQRFNTLTLERNYSVLFKEYSTLLRTLFGVESSQSLETIVEDLEDLVPLDRDTVVLYLSALNGDTLMLSSFEGDVTERLWEYVGLGVLDFDLQFILNDEEYFDDEYYVEDYTHAWNEVLNPLGKELSCVYNDDFSTGIYFIYVDTI